MSWIYFSQRYLWIDKKHPEYLCLLLESNYHRLRRWLDINKSWKVPCYWSLPKTSSVVLLQLLFPSSPATAHICVSAPRSTLPYAHNSPATTGASPNMPSPPFHSAETASMLTALSDTLPPHSPHTSALFLSPYVYDPAGYSVPRYLPSPSAHLTAIIAAAHTLLPPHWISGTGTSDTTRHGICIHIWYVIAF